MQRLPARPRRAVFGVVDPALWLNWHLGCRRAPEHCYPNCELAAIINAFSCMRNNVPEQWRENQTQSAAWCLWEINCEDFLSLARCRLNSVICIWRICFGVTVQWCHLECFSFFLFSTSEETQNCEMLISNLNIQFLIIICTELALSECVVYFSLVLPEFMLMCHHLAWNSY